MADSLQQAIDLLTAKIDRLAARCAELEMQKSVLESENEALNNEMIAQNAELDRLRKDNDFLLLSHRLAQDPDDIIQARRQIAKWIRDIDKCISQLKE